MIELAGLILTDPDFGEIWLPLIPIRFAHGTQTLAVHALVDSGSVITVLPYDAGVRLGFELEPGEALIPVDAFGSGEVELAVRTIRMRIGPYDEEVRIGWAQTNETIVLGRLDVFNRFDVQFRQSKPMIVFTPV